MTAKLYAVETRPRAEALADWHLKSWGFATLFPRFLQRRTIRGSSINEVRPLFPGYIFVEFDKEKDRWRTINSAKGVKSILAHDPENPVAIPQKLAVELAERFAAGPMPSIQEAIAAFEVGAEVSIATGPLAGKHGEFSWSDGDRCRLLVSLLGRRHMVSMPLEWIAPADDFRAGAGAIRAHHSPKLVQPPL